MSKFIRIAVITTFSFAACSFTPSKTTARVIGAADFQTTARDYGFAEFLRGLDLNSSDVKLSFKNTGTSVGLRVSRAGEKIGKWMPANAAANPEAQYVSYTLARFLHMSELVPAVTYYTLKGKAVELFRSMLLYSTEKNHLRQENKAANLARIASNPTAVDGVFVEQTRNDDEVIGLANPRANTINRNHPIAGFIRAEGPRPSASIPMTLSGLKMKNGRLPVSTELELAREFSKIMVLDALLGQWDRWSGGNVEARYTAEGRVMFIARDNGGAAMVGTKGTVRYFEIVTRFDREQVGHLFRLHEAIRRNPQEVAEALGLRSNIRHLQTRVTLLLQHIQKQEQTFGAGAYF